MARVRVGAEDVAGMFRPGGSVELLRLHQNEPDAISRISRGIEFAKQLYPIAGGLGKLIATGVGALTQPQQPEGGAMFQTVVPQADPETLRQQAAMRLLLQQSGQPAAQAAGVPQAAAPAAPAAPSPQVPADMAGLPQGAAPLRPELMQRITQEANQPPRPPVMGMPEQPAPEAAAPVVNPDMLHFDDADLKRYMDLKKELPGAQSPGVAQRILGEMQALQAAMMQKAQPQQPKLVRYTGPLTQDAMMRAMAAARTPDEQRAVLSRAGDVPVYSGDLLDLLTGSTGARTQFAQQLGGMAHTVHGEKTQEELDKLRAEAEKDRAMAGYYRERPDVQREDIRGKTERAQANIDARFKVVDERIKAEREKWQEGAKSRAAALQEKAREFEAKEKRLNEELQAKKRGIGAWRKVPGTVINVGRDTVQAGKAMVDAADDVIKQHGTRIRDIDKKLQELPVGDPSEMQPPSSPLDTMGEREKVLADPAVLKEREAAHEKAMRAYEDRVAAMRLRQKLEGERKELEKEARDPDSEVGQALRYRKKGMEAIERGTPQPKGK